MSACVCVRYVCARNWNVNMRKPSLNFVWFPVVWVIKMRAMTTKKKKKTKTAPDDDDKRKCGLSVMCAKRKHNTTHRTTLASHITACCENVFNVIHPIASIKWHTKQIHCACMCGCALIQPDGIFGGCLKFKSLSDRHHPNCGACDLTPVQKCQFHSEIRQTTHTEDTWTFFSILSYPIDVLKKKSRTSPFCLSIVLSLTLSADPKSWQKWKILEVKENN